MKALTTLSSDESLHSRQAFPEFVEDHSLCGCDGSARGDDSEEPSPVVDADGGCFLTVDENVRGCFCIFCEPATFVKAVGFSAFADGDCAAMYVGFFSGRVPAGVGLGDEISDAG